MELNPTIVQKYVADHVEFAVLKGLLGGGLDDIPQNRIVVLHKVHDELMKSDKIDPVTNLFLLEIENQVKKLEGGISN